MIILVRDCLTGQFIGKDGQWIDDIKNAKHFTSGGDVFGLHIDQSRKFHLVYVLGDDDEFNMSLPVRSTREVCKQCIHFLNCHKVSLKWSLENNCLQNKGNGILSVHDSHRQRSNSRGEVTAQAGP